MVENLQFFAIFPCVGNKKLAVLCCNGVENKERKRLLAPLTTSVLNLVPLREGDNPAAAIAAMVRLAQHVEKLGYQRYWVAEHHNTKHMASSATAILIGHALAHTQKIRVGSGGIMLPNHVPYIVAEQFGTLGSLYPGRVDLGLGRAPGTDQVTARALRRDQLRAHHFGDEIKELQRYFAGTSPVAAYPAAGVDVPLYVLGSSTDSAHLAAQLGLPYAFASHFAPRMLKEAVQIYREEFVPSQALAQPYVIVGANMVAAETPAEAERLYTSHVRKLMGVVNGTSEPLQPPVATVAELWHDYAEQKFAAGREVNFGPVHLQAPATLMQEQQAVQGMLAVSLVGDQDELVQQLQIIDELVAPDELITTSYIYDEAAELHSHEIFAAALAKFNELNR